MHQCIKCPANRYAFNRCYKYLWKHTRYARLLLK